MANQPVLIVGGICILIAIASFGIAGTSWSDGVDEFENAEEAEAFIKGPSNSFTYTYADDDGQGSGGWYVMMDGEYGDADGNDRTDACENVTFTITDDEGNDVTGEAGHVICTDSNEWRDEWVDPDEDDGRIVFGYVCATIDSKEDEEVTYTCTIGKEYTITSDTQLYVFYKDSYDLQFIDGLWSFLQSGFLGSLGACCCGLGGILVLVGALTGGKPTPMVGYMPQQGMMPQQPMQQQGMGQQMGQMPVQPQYVVGADIDSSSVADTPVSLEGSPSRVWDD